MKKYTRLFIAAVIIASLLVTAVACVAKDGEGRIILDVPKDIQLNGDVLEWGAVKNADGYIVNISGQEEKETEMPFYTVPDLKKGQYTIKIKSKGDGKTYADSEYSEDIAYTRGDSVATPTDLLFDKDTNTLSWTASEFAEGYVVYLNSGKIATSTNASCVINVNLITEPAIYAFQVQARGDGINSFDSGLSLRTEYVKSKVLDVTESFTLESSTFRWTAVDDNLGYRITATSTHNAENGEPYVYTYEPSKSGTVASVSNLKIAEPGEYTVTIQTKGDGRVFLESAESKPLEDKDGAAINVIKLAAPSNLNFDGKIYRWDAVAGTNDYEIRLTSGSTKRDFTIKTEGEVTTEKDVYNEEILKEENYAGKVFTASIIAKGNGSNILNSDRAEFGEERSYQPIGAPQKNENGVYEIKSAGDLAFISGELSANYTLTKDIDLKGAEWKPIGMCRGGDHSDCAKFTGSLDGKNYRIVNFKITGKYASDGSGLFACNNGKISNLHIFRFSVQAEHKDTYVNAGLIAGYNGEQGVIENCTVNGQQTVKDNLFNGIKTLGHAGGVVAVNDGKIIGVTADTRVKGDIAGGIAAINNGEIISSASYDSVDAILGVQESGLSRFAAGGIAGINNGGISHSFSFGNVAVSVVKPMDKASIAGGLAGVNKGKIFNSYADSVVSANTNALGAVCYAGGLVGLNEGEIDTFYSAGEVKSTDKGAGAVSVNNGTIRNGYTIVTVTAAGESGQVVSVSGDRAKYDKVFFNKQRNASANMPAVGGGAAIAGIIEKDNVSIKKIADELGGNFIWDDNVSTHAPILSNMLYLDSGRYRGSKVEVVAGTKPTYVIEAYFGGEVLTEPTVALVNKNTMMSFEKWTKTVEINGENVTLQVTRVVKVK